MRKLHPMRISRPFSPATRSRQTRRALVLLAGGGILLQVTGCLGGLAPVWASFLESTALSLLLQSLI